MKKPSKKEIQAAIAKLKEQNVNAPGQSVGRESENGKLAAQKSNQRIRKQGV